MPLFHSFLYLPLLLETCSNNEVLFKKSSAASLLFSWGECLGASVG